jgi:hypothetical protein
MKKMTSEIALCRDHWKYRSKISLPQIALHRYWNYNLTLQKATKVAEGKMYILPDNKNCRLRATKMCRISVALN